MHAETHMHHRQLLRNTIAELDVGEPNTPGVEAIVRRANLELDAMLSTIDAVMNIRAVPCNMVASGLHT